ncbi:hypothetical protein FRC04_000800 [Tulasnella sp. 424]|nr:hypothetical protein FRC04_000800 [Tulasnella sp. 424]
MSSVSRTPSEDDVRTVVGTSGVCSPVTSDDIEQQPLLAKGKMQRTPLPVAQLAVICLVRLAEPIAYTQIFPYINAMTEELHVTDNPADVGFYSGLVDSIFAVAQLFTTMYWGRLSDRIGRRPVMLTGLMGVAIGSFCFGLSKSFYQMLISRSIAGALSGNAAVVSSIMSEITDKTNQAQAFPLLGAFWCIGAIIGPLIGGMLSHPAERYPNIFGGFDFLKDKPYFLPCFISSLATCFSITIAYFFLEETLPSKVLEKKLKAAAKEELLRMLEKKLKAAAKEELLRSPSASSYGTLTPGTAHGRPRDLSTDTPPTCVQTPALKAAAPSTLSLLLDPRIRNVLISGFLLSFICVGWETVFVLWAYTPVSLGGLDRKPDEIGVALSSTAFLGIMISLFLFPLLHSRFGTKRIYVGSMCLWPVVVLLIPLVGWSVKALKDRQNEMLAVIWVGLVGISGISRFAGMAFSANIIMVKSAAPNQETLGSTFGLAQSVGSVARATGPAFASSLFAISIDKNLLGGNFVWVVLISVAFRVPLTFYLLSPSSLFHVLFSMSSVSRNPSKDDVRTVVGTSDVYSPITSDDIEQQPLLAKGKTQRTPLPVFQLAVLCLVRLAEPIAYTQIFPYVNAMIEELHVTDNPADIGFYSGLVDSIFAVAQLFTIMHWGRLSDRIGRRPVILTGLLGVAAGSFCFGLSGSFYQMLISRAMAGALSGNVAVVSSIMSEITDKTNQAQAFPLAGAFWCIGAIIGPLIGGMLSHPAERYPGVFGGFNFLKDKTLPSKVLEKKLKAAAKEELLRSPSASSYGTLTPSTAHARPRDLSIDTPPTCVQTPAPKAVAPSTLSLLLDPHIRGVLTAGFLLSFICVGWETVFVLWAYTPVSLGGLARKPNEIGYALSSTGFLGIMISLFLFPLLHSRFGTKRIYTGAMCLWPVIFVLIPLVGWLANALKDRQNEMLAVIWVGLVGISGISRFIGMAFSANMIMVKAAAPNQESLGSTFGLAQSVQCVARAAGPAVTSSLFAISIDKNLLGGNFVWVVLILVALYGVEVVRRLEER